MNVLGRRIEIGDDLKFLNDLKMQFEQPIYQVHSNFANNFNNFTSIDEIIQKLPYLVDNSIDKILEIVVKMMVSYKVYDFSKETFRNYYEDEYFDYSEYYYELKNLYLKIIGHEQQIKQARQIERSNRSKWQGGGFGIKGAIKGAATAGMLNVGTGLFRTIGDSITDSNDTNKIRKMKKSLFENEDVRAVLIQGMYSCLWGVFYATIDFLEKITDKKICGLDREQSETIFKNIKNYVEDEDEIIDGVLKSIKLYPYNQQYYEFLILKFKDPKNEIENLAQYFGYGAEIQKYKMDYLDIKLLDVMEKNIRKENNNTIVNIDKLEKEIKRLRSLSKQLGVNYEKRLSEIENIVYSCKMDKVADEKFKKISNMPEQSEEDINTKINELKKFQSEFDRNCLDDINNLKTKKEKLKNDTWELIRHMKESDVAQIENKINEYKKFEKKYGEKKDNEIKVLEIKLEEFKLIDLAKDADINAQFKLGELYEQKMNEAKPYNVKRYREKAIKYYTLASAQNHEGANSKLQEFRNKELLEQDKIISDIILKMNKNSKSELINTKNKIINLNYDDTITDKYIKIIDTELERIDLEARTFDQTVYNTEEECIKAKQKKEEEIRQEKMKEAEIQRRTVNGTTYDTVALAEKAKKKYLKEEKEQQKENKSIENSQKTLYKIINIIKYIIYYLVFAFSVLILIAGGDAITSCFMFLFPVIFIGLIIGTFGKIRLLKNRSIIMKIGVTFLFVLINWIIGVCLII